jgi:hypothetical protein
MAVMEIIVNINSPDTPTDWVPPSQKTERGKANFADIDNPGEWSQFVLYPEFATTAPKQYKRHSMPTGAQHREDKDNSTGQEGATILDMFPESRKGHSPLG